MTPSEEWRPVVGYEGYYEVSDHGNVRSLDRTITTKDGQVRPLRGQPIRSHITVGYPFVRLNRGGKAVNVHVHRLVAFAFIGNPEPGQEVCHMDGDRLNPHASNLRWDTRSANVRDAVAHGTHRNQSMGKTHCPQGHPYSPENTYVPPGRNERQCRTCKHDRYVALRDSRASA